MRKLLLCGLAVAALGVAALSFVGNRPLFAQEKPKPTKLIVADAKTTHHLNLYLAKEKGLFAKHNIEVEIVDVKDLAAARDLVVSGQADLFWACPTVGIAAIANGAPIKIISQVKTPCTSVLVVSKDSPIKAYTDLKGKNIAGISPTCEAVIALTRKAREANSPFNLEKLAGGPAIAALEAGKVDAAILEEPHVSIAELKGYKVLFREASADVACRTINARNGILKDNPAALKAFIKAVAEANEIILKDPSGEEVVTIAAKFTGAPKDAIKHGNDRLKFTTRIQEASLSALGDELITQKQIKENPKDKLFAEEFRGITWDVK